MPSLNASSNFTIVIPTYNRPTKLKRLLNYYRYYSKETPLVVADSSYKENKEINKKTILSISDMNINYLDSFTPDINGSKKICTALGSVSTTYCVICADDDFIIPRGINKCVKYLEENQDFSVAHGKYISFRIKEIKGLTLSNIYIGIQSITEEEPEKRLLMHMANYWPTFYAVHRTDLLKLCFEETNRYTKEYQFGELLPSAMALIYGKMRCLDLLYMAREEAHESVGRTCRTLQEFRADGTYEEKYSNFRKCLMRHMTGCSGLNAEEAGKAIDRAMYAYLCDQNIICNSKKQKFLFSMNKLLKRLNLPKPLEEEMRGIFRELFLRGCKRVPLSLSDQFRSDYMEDIEGICSYIMQ